MSIEVSFKECNPGGIYLDASKLEEIQGDSFTLSQWLKDEVGGYEKTLEYIENVLNGNIDEEELGTNGFVAYVKKDITEIHFIYEDECSDVKPCSLPTKMLRDIVKVWLKELNKFKANKSNS